MLNPSVGPHVKRHALASDALNLSCTHAQDESYIVDDLDGTDAVETVVFGLDGESFELDLSDANASALRQTFAPWVATARTEGSARRMQPPAIRRSSSLQLVPACGKARSSVSRLTASTWIAGSWWSTDG